MSDMRETWIPICPGLKRRTIALGEKMMQVYVILDAGARMPEHSHHHEQRATRLNGTHRSDIGVRQTSCRGSAL